MITIGKFLKQQRVSKKISFEALERKTKIKVVFLEAIENENWQKLPEFPVVLGFVKNIAKALNLDVKKAVALLRRDYPPRVITLEPKTEVSSRFTWSPKLNLILVIVFFVVLISVYLGYQAFQFLSPPPLVLFQPEEVEKIRSGELLISGKTSPDATVTVNNQPVLVKLDGVFETEILVDKDTKELVIEAKSRFGKVREIRQTIKVED